MGKQLIDFKIPISKLLNNIAYYLTIFSYF